MSPRTEEQLEQHREKKRGEIITAAMYLFAEFSYNATSINQIAKRAGIAKGLIYNYFPSKEDLLIAVVQSGFEAMGDFADPNFELQTKDQFGIYVSQMFDMLDANPAYWKVYFGMFLQPNVLNIINQHLGEMFTGYLMLFTDYYAAQGLKSPEIHARMLFAYMDGIGMHYLYMNEGFDKEKTIQLTVERFG